jgi:hypothetical protein
MILLETNDTTGIYSFFNNIATVIGAVSPLIILVYYISSMRKDIDYLKEQVEKIEEILLKQIQDKNKSR